MRAFVSVNPPPHIIAEVDGRLDALRRALPIAWTRPRTWHLTLQFLGDWPQPRLDDLQRALRDLDGGEPFVLRCGRLGTFPPRGVPRVLFLHLHGSQEAAVLAQAVRRLTRRVWAEGPQDDRPFQGHLTLARFRDRPLPQARNVLEKDDLGDFSPWTVPGFSLMGSVLDPAGAVHKEMAFFPLRKKGEKNPLHPV